MPKTAKEQSYTPTAAELTQSVTEILDDHEGASVKDMMELLQKQHATWKVPERRVAKIMKKRTSTSDTGGDTEEDASLMSNLRRGISKRRIVPKIRNALAARRSNRKLGAESSDDDDKSVPDHAQEKAPVPSKNLLPPEEPEDTSADAVLEPAAEKPHSPVGVDQVDADVVGDAKSDGSSPPPESAPAARALMDTHELETENETGCLKEEKYKDDNDGKAEPSMCTPCEGCVIL